MAKFLNFNYDSSDSVKRELFEGEFEVECVDAVIKETKTGTGEYILCTFRVPAKDTTVYKMFNIKNQNPKAVEIGLDQMKNLCEAGGSKKDGIDDLNDLLNIKCIGVFKIKKDASYGDRSEISYFKPSGKKTSESAPLKNFASDLPF